jgi:succinate dehydrogenase / fumarate reductase, cytochrome b subunit
MKRLVRLFRTSIGSKLLVAATGTLLVGFLLVHAGGNLLILKGRDALNIYADWMQGHPLLWGFRLGLLGLFAVHILTAIRLARENRAARPTRYRVVANNVGRLPARLMVFSGLLLLAFLIFHLFHLTGRVVGPVAQPLHDSAGRVDVYGMLLAAFSEPWIAAVYLSAMALLGLHLLHAIEGLFQTLGFNHESYQALIRFIAPALTLLIVGSFAAIPLLVLSGYLGAG